jgi:hypothetical protein
VKAHASRSPEEIVPDDIPARPGGGLRMRYGCVREVCVMEDRFALGV